MKPRPTSTRYTSERVVNISVRQMLHAWDRVDARVVDFMAVHGIYFMRISLAIVFIWFGLLKVVGRSPVADLVSHTAYWVPPEFLVPFLGYWEVAVGLGLLFRVTLRLTLLFFWLQMGGTFLVLVLRPDIAFQGGNPLLLTTEGEFVVKNLILLSVGLAIGGTIRHRHRGSPKPLP